MMMNCIAIDDEPLSLSLLTDNIGKVPYLHLAAQCGNAFEAIREIQYNKIDLIFVDIQMPGMSGLQFIASLLEKPIIILITAYKQYAVEGYSLDVVDYLVKPVPLERFKQACGKANELFQLRNQVKSGIAPLLPYMFVNVGYSLQKIVFDDIVYIEGLRYYINIHLKGRPHPVLTRSGMKSIEEYLPASEFIRIHKSFIVSSKHISFLHKNKVILENGAEFPIGETYKATVLAMVKGVR